MNVIECMKSRRSIRKYKPDPVDHSLIDSIVTAASFSPSWKNTQITRYHAIEDSILKSTIAEKFTPDFNAKIIQQAPVLMVVTYVKGRCGFERDGSFSTPKEDRWQMFDAGVSCQSFCLAAKEQGLGTLIMGLFDENGISDLLQLSSDQEIAALIAVGYPDIDPETPKRKDLDILLEYR